jgi:WXG100 family type VII secretion target
MPARKIQANYESLGQISQTFIREAQGLDQLFQQVGRTFEGLRNGGWVGAGANAFFTEMSELVIPALRRLLSALDDASSATEKISNLFQQSEQEAGNVFKGDLSGGGSFGSMADNIINGVINSVSGFGAIANGIMNGIGGGSGASGPGSFGSIADSIINGTGGPNASFGSIADSVVNSINSAMGNPNASFGSMADSIVSSLRGSAGGSFNSIADSIIGSLRGSTGAGSGPFNQLAESGVVGAGNTSERVSGIVLER